MAARSVEIVTTYNSIVVANGDIVILRTEYEGPYYYNILNTGPCSVYLRDDADPGYNDPHTERLPPGAADNLIVIPQGSIGLRCLAGGPCMPGAGPCAGDGTGCTVTLSVRLVRG